jgi:3-hydroxyisobutyrate dehydrogenase-like beta-hydroxyacid dehydrogenase
MKTLGLVGLGLVGKALAARLIAGGYAVAGTDTDAEARNKAQEMGVDAVEAGTGLPTRCDMILLSLPNSAVVEDVLWGDGGIGPECPHGQTILDTTTADPAQTIAHHGRLAERGVRFIDVPLVGSSLEIADGKAVALVGAETADPALKAVLDTIAGKVYYFGAPGHGHRAKLVANLVLGLNRLVLAEGLALAEKAGMDAPQMLDVLRNSAAYSRAMDVKGERMLTGNFAPAARLAQHAKDVGLIRGLAAEAGARVPVSELHAALLQEAIDAGRGALDNSAIIETFREGKAPGK